MAQTYEFKEVWKHLKAAPFLWKSKKAPASDLTCDYIYYCGPTILRGGAALVKWASSNSIFKREPAQ